MRLRMLFRAAPALALLAGCESVTQPPKKAEIACAESYLQYTRAGNYKCEEFGVATGLTQSTAKTFDVFGNLPDGTTMSVAVMKAWGIRTLLTLNYPVDPRAAIKNYNAVTAKATGWTPSRRLGPYTVVEFETESRHCHGFTRWGGEANGGYDHHLRGYFCVPRSKTLSDDEFRSLAGDIVVK